MASVSEEIVREYLELNEFAVKVHRKFLLTGAQRNALDEVDVVATNLCEVNLPVRGILLEKGEIKNLERFVMAVRGWHSEVFSPSRLKFSPELLNLAELDEESIKKRFFQGQSFSRVIVIPGLPTDLNLKGTVLQTFKEKGIDYVLDFKTILEELIERVEVSKNYIQSPTLQLIRILKRYDLIKDYQLELF